MILETLRFIHNQAKYNTKLDYPCKLSFLLLLYLASLVDEWSTLTASKTILLLSVTISIVYKIKPVDFEHNSVYTSFQLNFLIIMCISLTHHSVESPVRILFIKEDSVLVNAFHI